MKYFLDEDSVAYTVKFMLCTFELRAVMLLSTPTGAKCVYEVLLAPSVFDRKALTANSNILHLTSDTNNNKD